jgi:predicted ATPase/DNA-binding CsgD family transcriptional regulator
MHGFPASLTSFVGRADQVNEVVCLLGQYRLVTVTGAGGSGKTRLAGEAAGRVVSQFADGAWLAELAPVADPAQVPSAVAVALGIREKPGVPASGVLARVLARQQLLLVLDNCEHVIGAAAELCMELLSACDDVRILATSRQPLRTPGEAAFRLAPLTLPDPADLAGAATTESVMLFTDRARAADARFSLAGEAGPAVVRLVRRLDGMPLAIELAAARVEALGVSQLLDVLGGRLELLADGNRLAADRHRSLAATTQWSYLLLDDAGRRAFRQVSVFPAPFTLEAAEAVAGPGALPTVLHLVDCSLLVPPRPGPDGRLRYGMLETLRGYGAGLLAEAGERDQAEAALARHALDMAGQAAAGLQACAGEAAAARQLDAEDATMSQVLAWAMEHDPDTAVRLTGDLAWWWWLRGRLQGRYPLLREVAGRAERGSEGWCAVQFWLAFAALFSADLTGSLGHCTAVVEAVGGRGPSRVLADCLACRSAVLSNLGRIPQAEEDGRRSLALARELEYPFGVAHALGVLGIAAHGAGDLDEAERLARQAEQVSTDISGTLSRWCSYVLTWILIDKGDLAAAERVCAAALTRSRDVGDIWNLLGLLGQMGRLMVRAGRLQDAAAHLREVVQVAIRNGDWYELLTALGCCGDLCTATGRPVEAVTAWAAWAALSRSAGLIEPDDPARKEGWQETTRSLGSTRAATAEERGAAFSLDIAAEYALMLTAPDSPTPTTGSSPGQLSVRERELVTLVAQGHTDAQIAAELYISIRTVRSHLDRIRNKTGCRRRADLTRLALAADLL